MKRNLNLNKVKVSRQTEIAPGVFVLSFPRPWDFSAGQVLGIGTHATDEARLYSIASGELDTKVDVLYSINPGENLLPGFRRSLPATTFGSANLSVHLQAPMILPGGLPPATGIAPFSAMFRSGLTAGKTDPRWP